MHLNQHHIADIIWTMHKIGYTGALLVNVKGETFDIFLENGLVVHQVNGENPIKMLKTISRHSSGSFSMSDDKKTTPLRKIEITRDLIQDMIEISLTSEGYPSVSFPDDVLNTVVMPAIQITGSSILPGYINNIIRESKANPTIGVLRESLDISASDLISLLHNCLAKGLIKLQKPSGDFVHRSIYYRFSQPNRFSLQYKANIAQNSSLTATPGTIHVSRKRLNQMASFPSSTSVNSEINNIVFNVESFAMPDDKVMMSKPDITKLGLVGTHGVMITLTKED